MTKEASPPLPIPANKGTQERRTAEARPWEYDSELAQLKMAEQMVGNLGVPSIQTKEFQMAYSVITGMNHTPDNMTYFDTTILIGVLRSFAKESVNRDGLYFRSYWAYMMKPKYIIQGGQMIGAPEEQKESIVGRIANWFRGGKKNESAAPNQ